MYLEKINSPNDIKSFLIDDLPALAEEIRKSIIYKLSNVGGHLGPNLGVCESTVALHYVFNSPDDKIVWDVSHQCYAHKILTGRKDAFSNPDLFSNVTGYTNPNESEHDVFKIGHTSTSVSLALGLARGRDVCNEKNNIIAVIGDGSLSGGEAFEGLNCAGEYSNNLIIIINDNNQSIGENHGGLYSKLKVLRESDGKSSDNYFRSLGLDYRFLDDGHDITKLVNLFREVKDISHPVVLHICTVKGKGLPYAESDKESWHACSPFRIEDGYPKNGYPKYDTTLYDSIKELLDTDSKSIVLSAATPRAFGFTEKIRDEYNKKGRFIDVGIAEQTAVSMTCGIAKGGGNPVLGVYATFLQRAYDQLTHDVCLNNVHTTILVMSPGVFGMKSDTHIGMSDIQLISHIPNMTYLCPSSREEYFDMFYYSTRISNSPVAIRVPPKWAENQFGGCGELLKERKSKALLSGSETAIIAIGTLVPMALDIAEEYQSETGNEITVINPLFLSEADTETLESLKKNHKTVITLEDGELDGGFGQRIASFYGDSDLKVFNFGISKSFHSDYDPNELLRQNGISKENIIKIIKNNKAGKTI